MKVVVIGAGPAGLSCAHELLKRGCEVEVFEASPYVGGMSRSFDLWNQRVDLGPHRFFSKDPRINSFFKEQIGDDYTLVNRQTRIYYRQRFFDYPLKFLNVLGNLGIGTIIKILLTFLFRQLIPIRNIKNFQDWVTDRFGSKLFEIFFKSYTEKLWGIPCTEIDADWAAQRIKTLTLLAAVKASIFGDNSNRHKTLVDVFAYPKHGTGSLYEKTAKKISELGGEIHLSEPINRLDLDRNDRVKGVVLKSEKTVFADYVVSTMPLTLLLSGLTSVPTPIKKAAESLFFRNTILVYLEIDSKELFTDNWLYIHSPDVKHGRITNFRNWCPSLTKDQGTSILCLEFWCFEKDRIWELEDQAITAIAKKEVHQINLIPEDSAILNSKVIRVPKCYPVYKTGYKKHLNEVIDHLNTFENLAPIGRYGAYKYNNQDHSILMGLLAAEKIATGKPIDLWEINTDTEYQEDSEIKDVLIQ